MCNCNFPCFYEPRKEKIRKLSLILLDCWQREYDKRPYCNFRFDRLDFENRMKRLYKKFIDFQIIIEFLNKRKLYSIQLIGLKIPKLLLNEFIDGLKQLRNIELRLMYLPTEFYEIFYKQINHMRVKQLNLQGTLLKDPDVKYLQNILIESKLMEYLNISSCDITQYNFANIADGVHKSKTMRGFNCSRILGLHLTLDSDKIAHIISSLIWQNKLIEIILEQCGFIAHDMEIIAEYMYHNCSVLRLLNISNNIIGPDGAHYLLKAISASNTLTHLDMSGCNLGNHGGELISQYLSSCHNLVYLNITYNQIGPDVNNMILLTMKKPIKLHQLKIFGNKFNIRSGIILRRLLESRVLLQDCIDITVTFDDTLPGYRVIPWRT